MAVQILMPKLGMSTAPLTLVEWKAKEGEPVEQGNIVLVVETEKIRHDIEAEISGFLHILVDEGQEVAIGTVVGVVAKTKEELAALQKEKPKGATKAAEVKEAPPAEAAQAEAPPAAEAKAKERLLISPVARKLAEEHVIDITTITGTGPGGRIVREDIEKEIEAKKKAKVTPEITPEVYQGRRVKSVIPLKGMRKVIAEHMHRSLSISAQLTVMGEIDMTEMVKLRQSLVAKEKALGTRITYTDLFVFVAARLLKELPIVNASLIDNEIKIWENINIGVATALEEGLIVPVIKDADKKSLVEISKTVRSLVQKAREGKVMPDEVTGGTFTITNLGALGGGYRFETVIINQPEAAILGTGGITDRAVVRDGEIVIRPIMTYYFTYDHRVFTGAVAAQFMASATQLMETPGTFASLEKSNIL
jgi:pyruvate dehydrogenase E2 component (dihydrolipoamide acetyltransferase)/2-oxoglutarate dehydrogenase E2 component (dihydrolipoamide succinyltransferase)